MDPVVVVAVVAGSVVLAEQVALLTASLLGDDTAARAGRLWAPHKLVDLLGTVLVPALLALVSQGGALVGFGWGSPGPTSPTRHARLAGWRGVVTDVAAPLTHLVIALAGLQLHNVVGPGSEPNGVGQLGTLVLATNLVIAAFLMLPVPPLPGGQLTLRVLRGESAQRWERWTRWSRAPFGLAVAALVAWCVQQPA